MFDFAWSEIALIGVVALVAIGPKDMPGAIKTMSNLVKKARRMAGEFQTHVDEMVRDTELQGVRDQINQIRNFDFRGEIERHVDADGSIRSVLNEDPLHPGVPVSGASLVADAAASAAAPAPDTNASDARFDAGRYVPWRPMHEVPALPTLPAERDAALRAAPAFVPPGIVVEAMPAPASPAFIPPAAAAAVPRAQIYG